MGGCARGAKAKARVQRQQHTRDVMSRSQELFLDAVKKTYAPRSFDAFFTGLYSVDL